MKTLQTPTMGAIPLEKGYFFYSVIIGIFIITATIGAALLASALLVKGNLHKSIIKLLLKSRHLLPPFFK